MTFYAAMLTALQEKNFIPADVSNINDPVVRRAFADFGGHEHLNLMVDLHTAIEAFRAWLGVWAGMPPIVHKVWRGRVQVSYSVAAASGKGALTYTLEDELDPEAEQDSIDERILALTDMLRSAYVNTVSRRGAYGVPPSAADEPRNQPLPSDGGIPITAIVHGFDKGKHQVKVKGGEFQQFGVPIYKEALEAAGLTEDSYPVGEHKVSGWMWVHFKPDGKPKKVLKLEINR